jgi:hypothetical protein
VRGYAAPSTQSGRAMLQPLMLSHGFEAIEREGTLVFQMRNGRVACQISDEDLVARDSGDVETIRAPEPETPGRVRLTYIEAEGDFDTRSAETVMPDHDGSDTQASELSLMMTRSEARNTVSRWMAEARVARDTARFSLGPSTPVRVGDVVELTRVGDARLYRIDRMELTGPREVEAVRVEPGVYRGGDAEEEAVPLRLHTVPGPVTPVFLDLPLIRGDEIAHAPHLAVAARPWPGTVAAFDFAEAALEPPLRTLISRRATIGETLVEVPRARGALWSRFDLMVKLPVDLAFGSASRRGVLEGANLIAIGDGDNWEVVQYADAEPVAAGVWRLRDLLRGHFGTDAVAPPVWPAGSRVVLLDDALRQIDLPLNLRKIERHYRIGPASRPPDDPVYVSRHESFRGVGLRPYAPAHLRARRQDDGSVVASWIRRTRIDGDDWDLADVPMGEASERYLVRIESHGTLRREVEVFAPHWTYPALAQAADGTAGGFTLAVAQVSERFGPGPFASRQFGS